VDALWISPIYPSPMADFGYDVANYCAVDPRFGTLADFDALLAAAHARNLKVLLDFVPNHSSSQHPWFLESRASRESARRDWYIWGDPAPNGRPPNNWISDFGRSAWEWDEANRGLQAYSTDQPEVHGIAGEMRRIADSFGERVLIGEIYLPLGRLMHYYGRETEGVHLP